MFLGRTQAAIALALSIGLSRPSAAAPFAYISNQLADTVSVIDTLSGKVVDSIPVPGKPAGIALSPGGIRIYVSTPEAKGFSVIDAHRGKVIAKVEAGEGSLGIAASPDGRFIYVADWYNNIVSEIDSGNFKITRTLPTGNLLQGWRSVPTAAGCMWRIGSIIPSPKSI